MFTNYLLMSYTSSGQSYPSLNLVATKIWKNCWKGYGVINNIFEKSGCNIFEHIQTRQFGVKFTTKCSMWKPYLPIFGDLFYVIDSKFGNLFWVIYRYWELMKDYWAANQRNCNMSKMLLQFVYVYQVVFYKLHHYSHSPHTHLW